MNLQHETLTKENFWNEIYSKYPKACKLFCDWIDEYKEAVGWKTLFNPQFKERETLRLYDAPKFHDLPYELQRGIWQKFACDTLSQFFEQPEYEPQMDLANEIEMVFTELEPFID